jgi:hypothetical protein
MPKNVEIQPVYFLNTWTDNSDRFLMKSWLNQEEIQIERVSYFFMLNTVLSRRTL